MSVGKTLKKIRKEKAMTQVQFAEYLDMSRSFIGDIENDRYIPNPHTVQKLADKLGITTYYLTTGQKTAHDMTDEEMEELVAQEVESISSQISHKPDERLKSNLQEIIDSQLSIVEIMFLSHSLNYLRNSNQEEIKTMAGILAYLNYNKDIFIKEKQPPYMSDKEMLEIIEDEVNKVHSFFKQYFGYEEGD